MTHALPTSPRVRRGRVAARLAGAATVAAIGFSILPISPVHAVVADLCPAGNVADAFTDDDDGVHEKNANCASAYGLVRGVRPGTFDPTGDLTRGQAATILVNYVEKATGTTLPAGTASFSDVASTTHAANINKAAAKGIIRGLGDGSFAPGKTISRAQFASIAVQATEVALGKALPDDGVDAFTDDDDSVHQVNIEKAVDNKMLAGTSAGTFGPATDVQRGQVATITVQAAKEVLAPAGAWTAPLPDPITPPTTTPPVSTPADTTPPSAPVITSPTHPLHASTFKITGIAELGSTVKVFAHGSSTVLDSDVAGIGGAFSVDVPLTADSVNKFDVTATDAAGNHSALTAVTITEDTTSYLTVETPDDVIAVRSNVYEITGTAEAGSTVTAYTDEMDLGLYSILGDGGGQSNNSVEVGTTIANDNGDFSLFASLTENAPNYIYVVASDTAGNKSTQLTVPTITHDDKAPEANVTNIAAAVNTATHPITGTGEDGATITIHNADNSVATSGTVANGIYSINVTLAANTDNDFYVVASDTAGNKSTQLTVPTITHDDKAPPTPTVEVAYNGLDMQWEVAGNAEVGSSVRIRINSAGVITEGPTFTADAISGTVTGTFAAPSDVTFVVTAIDGAGNESEQSEVSEGGQLN